ncbi:hydroxymethylbilane synthase [Alkalibaculum sp. M08DMB]|uniref:Porphobilinogen deaminase n=1 Tax=Alkalibaculum sporogenes TaxID=2655001 RepID=A0A6A7KA59_9FIRM|nr:hydroxymethylbilane synthase [Alkalibaculum sporogenes]MPW26276.1 hydroxymethylbilane synthase [Alkalibaculum sporogenes]
MKVNVGTRGSKLALTQTKWVISQLKLKNPDTEFEIKIITTTGDRIQDVSLDKIGEKGVFVKEIEEQLLSGDIDLAIHSMKDMPGILPNGLMFSWVPPREDFRDALILKEGYRTLGDLPQGATIATGSKRRKYQLLKVRSDLNIVPIRGNIDTRLRKMKEQNLDGIILAAAGLKRLDFYNDLKENIELLKPNIMLPSPAQGALALEIREDHKELHQIIESIKDEETHIQVTAERAFLTGINGNCHIPIGALCTIKGHTIELEGLLGNEDGSTLVNRAVAGNIDQAEELGYKLAKIINEELKKNER